MPVAANINPLSTDGGGSTVGMQAEPSSPSSGPPTGLQQLVTVDDITTLFQYDPKRSVIGSGMYATVYRALPTPEGIKRLGLASLFANSSPHINHNSSHNNPHHNAMAASSSPMLMADVPAHFGVTSQDPVTTSLSGSRPGSAASNDSPVHHHGGHGSPYLGGSWTTTNQPHAGTQQPVSTHVALKVVEVASMQDAKEARNVMREISILKRLHHPNVVGFLAAVQSKSAVYIAMPLACGVTLTQLLAISHREAKPVPEKAVRCIVRQLLAALHYVHHARGMIHRDVKLDNVLVAVSVPSLFSGGGGGSGGGGAVSPQTTVTVNANPGPSQHARRESTNKATLPAASSMNDLDPMSPEHPSANGSFLSPGSTFEDLADPVVAFQRLFEPGVELHVTLVDFGFARTITPPGAVQPPSGPAQSYPSAFPNSYHAGGSPVATPTSTCTPHPTSAASAAASASASSGAGAPLAKAGGLSPRRYPGDFPACQPPSNPDAKLQYTPCGAPRFMPPEALAAMVRGGHTKRCANGSACATATELRKFDPFAVGVVAYALLSHCYPWTGETAERLLDAMQQHGSVRMKATAWQSVTDSAKEFIRAVLRHSSAERLTVEQALHHRWFTETSPSSERNAKT
jgi:serine/threonine protein kinase